jgi:transposase
VPVDDAIAQLTVGTQELEDRDRRARTSPAAIAAGMTPAPVERHVGWELGKHTTKQGNGYLRALLTQAAWLVQRQRGSDPLKTWG